ncbi:MAG: glycogen/starch/alpha-glucan family phosphorylase [Clostridia bacterium]|nr:glycogen/starch/alpha-glucan family phosphorylase [Clostridia bacterium]
MDKNKFLNYVKDLDFSGISVTEIYNKISNAAVSMLNLKRRECRYATYISIEYLVGNVFYNNLMALGVLEQVTEILEKKGVNINIFEEIEDAALGNGGLGRLAACFLDSAAAKGYPLYGYGIRYKYGLFKQVIEKGCQTEYPDDWQKYGDPWSIKKEEESRTIHFKDYDVKAVPYDMLIIGKRINALRLFEAEGEKAKEICEYLYPPDDTEQGKLLRIRQEYFLSAATIGELIDRHISKYNNILSFSKYNCIQLNDTHPVMAIAEFIRILTSIYNIGFDDAVKAAKKSFNYTNHTIMPEALECWDYKLIEQILPDIANVLIKLHNYSQAEWNNISCQKDEMNSMAIFYDNKFSMANTAVYIASSVNGVAEIHTEIIKKQLFSAANKYYPSKFKNVTNGVTHRRWLQLCNKELSALLDDSAGKWRDNIHLLKNFIVSDNNIKEFKKIKALKKRQLADYILKRQGIKIDSESIVYCHIKRLHEYKRQLMTAFAILCIYYDIKTGKLTDFYPSTFIFGGKAAAGYFRAKGIIKYINEIADMINNDAANDKIKVVFAENYNVSYAEKIIAGSDVSLQVSTAGMEASGTGNMKLMMNGAVTAGTMDGANIEIVQKAGKQNNYIFGATVEDIEKLVGTYCPVSFLEKNPKLKYVVNTLIDGTFSDKGKGWFEEIYNSLTKTIWHRADNYFVLYDLPAYVETLLKVNEDYKQKDKFAIKAINNIANSGYFSSDRTIAEYAKDIWKIDSV